METRLVSPASREEIVRGKLYDLAHQLDRLVLRHYRDSSSFSARD